MKLNSVEELVADIRQGKMVILMDDEDRENEGDLIMAASLVTPESVNFMARYARGLICLTLRREKCEQLKLPLMVDQNNTPHGTNFTLSIEAASGVTTGISAADRAHTIRVAVKPDAKPEDIIRPGHVFPLMASPGGVLHRAGHTEAGCDLAHLAGLDPSAVIVEIMNDDGTMARRADLESFAEVHQLKIGTIADLIQYRAVHAKTVELEQEVSLDTQYGCFRLLMFKDLIDDQVSHLALVKGDLEAHEVPYVRVHVADPIRDLLGAKLAGKQGWSLHHALTWVGEKGGVLVLLDQGRDGLLFKPKLEQLGIGGSSVYAASQAHSAESPSAYRTIGTGSQILRMLNISQMKLLSSKLKFNALSGFGLEIIEYVEPLY